MNPKISYWLDSHNIICKVDDAWDTHLDAGSWTERASSQGVVGKNLLEFICDDITRMFVATMIEASRLSAKTLTKPYRCDAPDKKRFMQMTISPGVAENGWLCVSHELLREEPLAKPVFFENVTRLHNKTLTDPKSVEPADYSCYLMRCSICNRLKEFNSEQWHEIEDLPNLELNHSSPLKVVFGVCSACMAALKPSKALG